MNNPEALAREVKAELARQGLTQRALAKRLDVPYRTVQHRLSGRVDIRLTDLDRIATALDVKVSDLMARAEGGSAA